MLQFALILLFCAGTFAHLPSIGKCPDLTVVQEFDVQKYAGTWYEFGRYLAISEMGGKCNKADFSISQDESLIKIVESQVNILTGSITSKSGVGKLIGKGKEAKLSVIFPSQPVQVRGSLWILDTDYTSFAVAYSCHEFGFFHTKSAWILSRERIPEEANLQKAFEVFDNSGFKRKYLVKTDQEDCSN